MIRILVFVLAVLLGPFAGRAGESRDDLPLAVNLAGVNDWSSQQPFIDVMKTARRWIGHKPGQWGGVSHDELAERGVLDAHGWPTEIPGDLSSIGTLILTDLPEEADIYAGTYVLRFEGEGIVEVGGAATNVRYGEGRVTFDFTPGGTVLIKIQRSDPRGSGDYVRDITVVKDENEAAWQRGEIFNPAWTRHLEGFEAVRFMDWMETNDSTQSDWSGRPRVTDFSYGLRGVPVEIMVALANRLDAAPWFTMPHLADDAYNRAFAEMVAARLDPYLGVYVEYSNEVWNWQFDQADWAEAQARARWDRQHRWMEYYGMKAARVADIWAEVFAGRRDRLVNVIAVQTGWLGLEKQALEAPLWVAEDPARNAPPHTRFDAYAVTGYFGYGLGSDKRRDMVRDWIAKSRDSAERAGRERGLSGGDLDRYVKRHRYDEATRRAAQELWDGAMSGEREGSLADMLDRVLPYHAEVAGRYGFDLVAYEGGTHVVGLGHQVNDEALTGFFTHLNYTPDMARLYERLLRGWSDLGGGLFAIFSDVLVPTKWGSWGHLRHLGDDNPRWRAVSRFR